MRPLKILNKYIFGLYVILGIAMSVIIVFSYIMKNEIVYPNIKKQNSYINYETTTKYILYWTPMYRVKDWYFGYGNKFSKCKIKNCFMTDKRDLVPIENFSAILFHGYQYAESQYGKPKIRTPNQIYVYGNIESPLHTNLTLLNSTREFYNWTMTYRLDSDVVRPYGTIIKTKTNYILPSVEEIKRKQFRIAWFVSHCSTPSERMKLAKEINKSIPVDIYGVCGPNFCPRRTEDQCYEMVEKKYKFYFSAENSICKDYITEKLYNLLRKNVVPLVYGGAEYHKFAPPKSIIDVSDFDKVEELATYLKFLNEHPEKYIEYFEWKKSYRVLSGDDVCLCSLCEKLHENHKVSIYKDITSWWTGESSPMCKTGKDLPNIVKNIKNSTND